MSAQILVENLSIDFPIYHGNARSLKKTMLAAASGRFGEDRKNRVVVQALRDVSFRLSPGDRLALVGGNGAGKTTLLRVLAGIYEPVLGHVHIDGVVGSMLDANLGMNMDLSGRENIMLRGLYNGLSRTEIARHGCGRRSFRRVRGVPGTARAFLQFGHDGTAGIRHGNGDEAASAADG